MVGWLGALGGEMIVNSDVIPCDSATLQSQINAFLIFHFTDSDYEETLAAMQCANRTKLIENAIKANEVLLFLY